MELLSRLHLLMGLLAELSLFATCVLRVTHGIRMVPLGKSPGGGRVGPGVMSSHMGVRREEAHAAAARASQSPHLKIEHINNILMLREDVRGLAGSSAFRRTSSARPLVSRSSVLGHPQII